MEYKIVKNSRFDQWFVVDSEEKICFVSTFYEEPAMAYMARKNK